MRGKFIWTFVKGSLYFEAVLVLFFEAFCLAVFMSNQWWLLYCFVHFLSVLPFAYALLEFRFDELWLGNRLWSLLYWHHHRHDSWSLGTEIGKSGTRINFFYHCFEIWSNWFFFLCKSLPWKPDFRIFSVSTRETIAFSMFKLLKLTRQPGSSQPSPWSNQKLVCHFLPVGIRTKAHGTLSS